MGEILLIAEDWRFRALVRAQLLEEGYQVTALLSLEDAATCLRQSRDLPRLLILDAKGMVGEAGALSDLLRLAGGVPVVCCSGLLSRRVLAQGEALPARVLHRPFSVGDVVEEVRKLIPWPEEDGRTGARLVP